MIRFLFPLIILVLLVVLARRYIAAANHPGEKHYRKISVALWVFAAIMVLLTLLHRMHWSGALLAVVLPLLRALLHRYRNRHNKEHDNENGQGS